MGLGGISLWQLLIVLVIVILIFGTKRLGSIGKDLGGAIKGFRGAMNDADVEEDAKKIDEQSDAQFSESSADEANADRNQAS
jgi:sec-independent protein translocase protein TatA